MANQSFAYLKDSSGLTNVYIDESKSESQETKQIK